MGRANARRWRGGSSLHIVAVGAVLLLISLALPLGAPALDPIAWWTAAALVLVQTVAAGTVLELRGFSLVPTKPVFVAALLLLPAGWVPAVVALGAALALLRRPDTAIATLTRLVVPVGAALAATVVPLTVPDPGRAWVVALTLVVHLAVGVVVHLLLHRHLKVEISVRAAALTLFVDVMLVQIGLAAALAAQVHWMAVLVLAGPVALVAFLATDQQGMGQLVRTARTEARIDPLTGLGNRRAWLEAVDAASRRDLDPQAPFGVVMADLDNLKFANDTLGHAVGDDLISAIGQACQESAPAGAVVCRIGGDEFAILVPDATGRRSAVAVAAQLRSAIAQRGRVRGVLLSAGVGAADCPPLSTIHEAADRADAMVIAEKRNRITSQPRLALSSPILRRIDEDPEPTIRIFSRTGHQRRRAPRA